MFFPQIALVSGGRITPQAPHSRPPTRQRESPVTARRGVALAHGS
jgi:hypothetical protein